MRLSGSSRAKVVREMKVFSAGDPMAMCKAGEEIHLKPFPNQTPKTMATLRRFKRNEIQKRKFTLKLFWCAIVIISEEE